MDKTDKILEYLETDENALEIRSQPTSRHVHGNLGSPDSGESTYASGLGQPLPEPPNESGGSKGDKPDTGDANKVEDKPSKDQGDE